MRKRLGGNRRGPLMTRAVDDLSHLRTIIGVVLVFSKDLSKNLDAPPRVFHLGPYEAP